MAMKKWWIENGTFVTMDEASRVVQGHLVVEGDRIAYIGEAHPGSLVDGAHKVNGGGLLFMPGLINTHGHAAMTLLRGVADDMVLQEWLAAKIWPMEGRYTAEDVRWGTSLAALEMLKSGTTAFVDMYDHMDEVAQVVEASGMRGVLMRGVIGLCPEDVQREKLAEAVRFARNWHGKANGRITAVMSPHSPYTCPPALIEQFVQAAHDLDLPLHTHMSETAAEVEQNVREYGLRPALHLDKLGFFSRPSLVAHAVHLTDDEIVLLAERGVGVAHNPASNLKLASGVARVPAMLAAGITVGLATDGAASNNNLDMFDEIRLAALIHKGVSGDPTAVPALEALRMGTVCGAKAIWQQGRVGMLKAGMKADFIALDFEQPHFYPHTDPVSHLVYAGNGRDVRHVWVDGVQVVDNRRCTGLDEEKIRVEAQRCYERLSSAI
ncbi:MAG TPA: amidohydrolase [Paenibacillus sp.]|uniref:amidohydrolase n=1 Tax=Paenibacillus sp. TaxID=58172 RepID=UPI002D0DB934|nr:amidohydrolase [Paenibacillus sp.]HUC90708.1 amidohydrolase [Paenibacillus sp.]